jgi:polyphosphate kinase
MTATISGGYDNEVDTKLKQKKLPTKVYEKELLRLQTELVVCAEWIKHSGARVVALFEGRDAAGKGGVLKRITQLVSPRVVRVEALPAPTEREQSQWYFQRYIAHLPAGGEIVLFDRSWYNRAGVERVMGFCTPHEYQRFLRQCPIFERMLVDDGIVLLKYWFSVSDDEQERRFQARIDDPTKQWKLSPMDLESRTRYVDYSRAKDEMFLHTDTPESPWYVVESDDKKAARLNCIAHFLSKVPYDRVPSHRIKLPRRQPDTGYVRPPRDIYTYVPDHASTLMSRPS